MANDTATTKRNDPLERTAAVAACVQMVDVRLWEARLEQKPFDDDLPRRITTNISVETHVDRAKSTLKVLPQFSLLVKDQDGSPEQIFVRIEAMFVLTYVLSSQDNLTQEDFEAFGERNGVFNVWPYWREFVQSTTVRMGLPPLTLPVFRVGVAKVQQMALPGSKVAKQIGPPKGGEEKSPLSAHDGARKE